MPKSVEIGRGFVITDEGPSKQIDILIYDSGKPVLFQDGDLVFTTPDAVHGVIEVKTSVDNTKFRQTIEGLCSNSELIRRKSPGSKVFALFSYEDKTADIETTLAAIRDVAEGEWNRIVHCVCLGETNFIRYWNLDPVSRNTLLDKWHAYQLAERRRRLDIFSTI